jgi:hypothetical protein
MITLSIFLHIKVLFVVRRQTRGDGRADVEVLFQSVNCVDLHDQNNTCEIHAVHPLLAGIKIYVYGRGNLS